MARCVSSFQVFANRRLIPPSVSAELRTSLVSNVGNRMRLILLSIFAFVVTTSGAAAKYRFCNKTSYALSAAIGYVDGDRLATRGWWRLRPGECKIVLTEKTNPGRYFVYAQGIPGHRGPLRTWSGETPLCVEKSGFFNLRNQEVCRTDPTRQRLFFDVEVTDKAGGNWQTDFTEAKTYSVYSAKVAGLQRLLNDVGLKAGRIDGAMGRATQRVMEAYKKKKGIAKDANNDTVIDQLIEDANARESKLGFYYCNKTDHNLWSAIAEPNKDEKTYSTRGWWNIAPGVCTKILKGELEHEHYYVYAIAESADQEFPIMDGDKNLCVTNVMFETDGSKSCADQNFDEAAYRRVEVGASPSATFEFLPDMFPTKPAQ